AWLLLQVVDIIGPRWGMTDTASRMLDVVLVVGFAATLVLAWYHGEQGRQRVNGVELLMLSALLFLAGIGLRLIEVDPAEPGLAAKAESSSVESSGTDVGALLDAAATVQDRLRTIAVLPFDNYSPNEADAYFAAGITEEITGQLSRIGELTVLSRVAVERAMETEDSLEAVARALGAGSVLEGSVRMADSRVRITAQLIDVASKRHLWSDNFDRELDDIFQIQTNVALAIGDALLAQLTSGERKRIETPPTGDIRAYQLYLRQQQLLGNNFEQNRAAIGLLEQALALDPDFAEARARLSWRHTWEMRLTGDRALAERARQLALEAIEQDPDLSPAYRALGAALEELEQMGKARAAYQRAYETDPNAPSILADGSFFHAMQGYPSDGLEMAFHAVRLDPNDPNMRWHAYVPLLYLGDNERTAAWLRLALEEGMDFHRLAAAEAELQLITGNPERAAALAREMLTRYPDTPEATLMAQWLLFLTGNVSEMGEAVMTRGREMPDAWTLPHIAPRSWRVVMGLYLSERGESAAAAQAFDQALATAEAAVARGSTYHGRALDLASIHALRGDRYAALSELERAFELGFRADFALAIDPFFESLHEEPRFKALLRRMADSQRQQLEGALQKGLLEDYDALIAAGPTRVAVQ
ncbi:MAG: hypothetical protein WBM40_10705, partial [Thiohalocapsa sp.]